MKEMSPEQLGLASSRGQDLQFEFLLQNTGLNPRRLLRATFAMSPIKRLGRQWIWWFEIACCEGEERKKESK